MASNHHINGGAVAEEVLSFPKPVNYLNIFVDTGVNFRISFDGGDTFLTIPPGITGLQVGPIRGIVVTSDGLFNLVGVHA